MPSLHSISSWMIQLEDLPDQILGHPLTPSKDEIKNTKEALHIFTQSIWFHRQCESELVLTFGRLHPNCLIQMPGKVQQCGSSKMMSYNQRPKVYMVSLSRGERGSRWLSDIWLDERIHRAREQPNVILLSAATGTEKKTASSIQ